jgi:hypothetical protein
MAKYIAGSNSNIMMGIGERDVHWAYAGHTLIIRPSYAGRQLYFRCI